ncbi:uncharacterized protein HMPREF1541_02888 [Cyphellophora europaea CBS 101466]|uniref:YbhB/YbcL family Raf kinase inhibitor-like protein n=1 Tax=Cyphellophora europaea (strain CBS 101466) TaxID=1220924 RepID=W2S714_CYPE1|nr:uncharacterized protein HMPREF1541_02888 [Cyphellophora europaea CBS 101466]ETN43729.1 hypothetical protein HMPREF1541_02888 [Cyphellophora europaea CBS 101466]
MWKHFLTALLATSPISARWVEQQPIEQDYLPASAIRDTLKDNKIIGDVLDDFEPTFYLDIAYPEYHETVLLGNDIPVKHVQHRPTFVIHAINAQSDINLFTDNATFTLALTDPDAKSRNNPKWSEMCHWLLSNLTTDLPGPAPPPPQEPPKLFKVPGELKGYKPPGPPPKTGAHRYVFVLLQGSTHDLSPPKDRQHWGYGEPRHGVRDWARENDQKVVGANFFFAQNKKQ